MNHVFDSYEPYKGDIVQRDPGVHHRPRGGRGHGLRLFYAQDRGRMFIGPGVEVYEGMVVGPTPRTRTLW